jgi:hypothetical protein
MEFSGAISFFTFQKISADIKISIDAKKCASEIVNVEATRSQPHIIPSSLPRKISAKNILARAVLNDASRSEDQNRNSNKNEAAFEPS